MGKKHKPAPGLGRTLIKDRFGTSRGRKFVSDNSMLHTTEIQDGYDWGRLNLQSVTEESSFQEFLSTAELAGTEFQAEKLNIKFVNPRVNAGLLSADEKKAAEASHKKHKELLKIPRRPKWDSNTTPEELDKNEREAFLEWRRTLAALQEDEGILLTPYEKNLEFWRQLWRVVERSDVVVQIVDARNPLMFWCEDLGKYVKEVSDDKMNLVLVNKADFLTEKQRQHWADYFSSIGVRVVFFSAVLEQDTIPEDKESVNTRSTGTSESDSEENLSLALVKKSVETLENAVEENAQVLNKILNKIDEILIKTEAVKAIENNSDLLTREQLINLFKTVHKGTKYTSGVTTIGLVGYPNVGKSSTINALMSCKKVSVSATPGKTKHFQTLYLDNDLLLCDCPGLVMPSFVFTKADMVLNGILPIDQMRDHVPPTNLITSLIPRHVIEDRYGIMLPRPMDGEDETRNPTAEELLNTYAYNRGFMTANGQPDNSRASRYILKDFMNGKLLYCHAPPTVAQEMYHTWPERQKYYSANKTIPPRAARAVKPYNTTSEDIDSEVFRNQVHMKGKVMISSGVNSSNEVVSDKPWKKINKHGNKNKKEKSRRVYAHLDQH